MPAMKTRIAVALLSVLLLPATAGAAPTACPQHFAAGQAPDLTNPKLAAKTRPICFRAHAVLHSGITRTPLWTAERLTKASLKAAVETPRKGTFHEEPRLPPAERAELSDYVRSGYDRGHMVPAADAPDDQAQQETFSLANIVPQNGPLNRGLWSGIEDVARDLARKRGELYVVTGAIFEGDRLQRLKGRVLVPTSLFKAVYDPQRREAGAYVTRNEDTDRWEVMSLAQLQELSGIDPFPGAPADVRATAMTLPAPRVPGKRRDQPAEQRREGESSWTDTLKQFLR